MTIKNSEVIEKLRDLRSNSGYTQAQIASSLGIHRASYSHIERGSYHASDSLLRKLEQFFHVPEGTLVKQEEKPPIYHLGDYIRALRKERGWTQLFLAQKACLDDASISAYECGAWKPSLSALEQLAKAFGIDVLLFESYLLTNIQEARNTWNYIICEGILCNQKVRIELVPPPRVHKPLSDDFPEPVWITGEYLPAQWISKHKLKRIEKDGL